jgi:hypothetical protein
MVEICRESPNEARHGPVLSKHEHGRARWEEGPGLAISGRVDQGEGGRHRRATTVEDYQAQKHKGWPMVEECGEQAAAMPKATLDILMADIRGHENRTI